MKFVLHRNVFNTVQQILHFQNLDVSNFPLTYMVDIANLVWVSEFKVPNLKFLISRFLNLRSERVTQVSTSVWSHFSRYVEMIYQQNHVESSISTKKNTCKALVWQVSWMTGHLWGESTRHVMQNTQVVASSIVRNRCRFNDLDQRWKPMGVYWSRVNVLNKRGHRKLLSFDQTKMRGPYYYCNLTLSQAS